MTSYTAFNFGFRKAIPTMLGVIIGWTLLIIILQLTISVVFFDSLWIKTNKGMTRALVAEIKTFIDAYDNDETNKDFVIEIGTGTGNLTDEILKKKPYKFFAIEKDEKLIICNECGCIRKSHIYSSNYYFEYVNSLYDVVPYCVEIKMVQKAKLRSQFIKDCFQENQQDH